MNVSFLLWAVLAAQQTPPVPANTPPSRAGGPGRVSIVVAALDTDKNGTLSASEIAAASGALQTLDKNRDGKLAPDELRPPPPPVVVPTEEILARLLEFDRNGDKQLTTSELPSRMQTLWEQADSDKNGVLTAPELTAHIEKQETIRAKAEQEAQKQQAAQPPNSAPPNGPGGQRGPGGPGGGRVSPIVAALDTDKDGTVSDRELAAASTSLKTLDKNGDGELTEDELRPPPPPEGQGTGGERKGEHAPERSPERP